MTSVILIGLAAFKERGRQGIGIWVPSQISSSHSELKVVRPFVSGTLPLMETGRPEHDLQKFRARAGAPHDPVSPSTIVSDQNCTNIPFKSPDSNAERHSSQGLFGCFPFNISCFSIITELVYEHNSIFTAVLNPYFIILELPTFGCLEINIINKNCRALIPSLSEAENSSGLLVHITVSFQRLLQDQPMSIILIQYMVICCNGMRV